MSNTKNQPHNTEKTESQTSQDSSVLDIGQGTNLILPTRENLVGGLKIVHKFSSTDIHPYDQVEWELRDIAIYDFKKGKNAYERNGVEVPKFWDSNAAQTTVSKYLFGNSPDTPEYENSLKNAFDRIANTYTIWGWKHGYFLDLESAKAFNWELKYMLVNQIWSPNSPVWFNIGHWEQWRWGRPDLREALGGNVAFKAFIDENNELIVKELKNSFEHGQMSACFLTGVEDSMEAILQHQIAEGRIFSSGSGVGINISSLRSSKEPIAGKGKSSGPISFDKGWDKTAGAIKSGGKCLAPWQQVYTENGPVEVRELANKGNFVGLSYDPMAGRIMAKRGQAWMAGIKEVVEIITDKGTFALSTDHPVRTADHQVVEAGKLRKGMHLHAGAVDMGSGYLRVHLQNGKKGKAHLHRMIAEDVLGHNIKGLHVHHKDENKLNNSLENLEILTVREHHQHHSFERVAAGEHAFQKNRYPKPGKANPMHSTSKFWGTKEAKAYRKLQGEILKRSSRASEMQGESTKQRMLNKLWETSNAGGDISSFEAYYSSRRKLIGRIDSKKRLESDVKKHFESFSGMLEEMNAKNHTVIEVRNLGVMETYDVEIACPSPDDKTAASGHNFLIWSNTNSGLTGSGIFVLNTRRAARMTLMDSNHPDIMTFINLKNEQEHLAKVILREHNSHVQLKAKAEKTLKDPKATVSEQLAAEFILSLPLVTNEEYSGAMDGIVYGETISNQNANHSVSLLGDFWDAYYSKGNYSTRWVTKPDKIDATFPASDLLSAMAKSVYDNAEPGCHNNDWINLWSPYKSVERLTTSNPCITGDSLVETSEGLVQISELVGKTPEVLGADRKFHRASAVFPTGVKPVYLLETEKGRSLKLTADHKVATSNRGDVEAAKLTPEDAIITSDGKDDKLKSFAYIGEEQVYDLTEPVTSHFTANGILIHNCSEYLAPVNTSCNLSSFNAYRFLDKDTKEIKTDLLEHGALLAMIVADLNIEEGGFPIPEIARETYNYRTTGIGYGNIGGLLMSLGIPYDSDEGRLLAATMTSFLHAATWKASYQMGREYGTYRKYAETKNDLIKVLDMHIASDALLSKLPNSSKEKIEDVISKGPNNTLPSWGNLSGRGALRALANSFNLDGEWDAVMLKTTQKLAAASTALWREVKKEMKSGQPRNSFTSLYAPGGCLVENSLVLTGSGLKRIRRMGNPYGDKWQEINVKVQTDMGPKQATKFFVNGKAQTRIIRTERLNEIQGTEKHKVKKLNTGTLKLEWVEFKNIKPGDILATRVGGIFGLPKTVWLPKMGFFRLNAPKENRIQPGLAAVPEVMTPLFAEFLGVIMGSGTITKDSVEVTCSDESLSRYVQDTCALLFGAQAQTGPAKVVLNSSELAHWLTACGVTEPQIPDLVLESNCTKIYNSYLSGLRMGSCQTTRVTPTSPINANSKAFGLEIMTLMLTLGTPAKMNESCIVEAIGHEAGDELVPISSCLLDELGLTDAEKKTAAAAGGIPKSALAALTSPVARLSRLAEYSFDRVSANIDGGIQDTYDLSVPENVTYIANGFVSHNTISAPLGIYDEGTTSAEPDYTLVKYKVLAGGGMLRMFNRLALEGLKTLGYSDWHVKEAAFEVAGLNGLYVACQANIDACVKHLVQKPEAEIGPVRKAYSELNSSSPEYQDPQTMMRNLANHSLTGLPDLLLNGKSHVESIPWLSDHHKAVFDCAATAGDGTRAIAPSGHIKMLGALQPFVSGAISKCVTGDTVIVTSKGLTRIGSLYTGQQEDSFSKINFQVPSPHGKTQASDFYFGGIKKVWEITLEDGRVIKGTDVHRLRTAKEEGLDWTRMPDLQIGDWVALQQGTDMWGPAKVPQNIRVTAPHGSQNPFKHPNNNQANDVALFLGMLTADGHVTRSNYSIHLTKNCPNVLKKFRALLLNLFGLHARLITDQRNGVTSMSVGSKSLMEWLDGVGFSKRAIPDFILSGSKEMLVSYLSGLYLDGWISKGQDICISQKNQQLLREVQAVWDNIGVATYFSKNVVGGKNYPVLHICSRNRQIAAKTLQWLEPHKADRAKKIKDYADKDLFPMHRVELSNLVRKKRSTMSNRSILDPRTHHMQRNTILKVAKTVGYEIPSEELVYSYSRVVGVELVGEEAVYDISVPETEQFVGNGIVNHNTVNLPYYATVEEILHCFEMSHKLGVKCIALYRDGSKGVSVYQTNSPESQKWIVDNIWKKTVESIETKTNEIVAKASVPRRKKLEGRRWSQVVKFGIAGQGNLEGFLIVGMYPDGTCGEVFGKLGQGGSFAHGMFESFCKAFSVMLQWGVPFPQAIGTFKSMAFDPSGFTKVGDPDSEHSRADIKSCKSVVDLVMQILKWMFPEENSYKIRDLQSSEIHLTSTLVADQRPAMMPPTLGAPYGEQRPTVTKVEEIDLGAAETCPDCGSLSVIQDGRCRKCTHCGYSSGGCGG